MAYEVEQIWRIERLCQVPQAHPQPGFLIDYGQAALKRLTFMQGGYLSRAVELTSMLVHEH